MHAHAHVHAHAHALVHVGDAVLRIDIFTHDTRAHMQSHPPASSKEKHVESYCAVLNCLQQCLAKVRTV